MLFNNLPDRRDVPLPACPALLGAVTDAWRLQASWTQHPPDVGCPCKAEGSGEIARCRLAPSAHPPGAGGCYLAFLEAAADPSPPLLVRPPAGVRVLGRNDR